MPGTARHGRRQARHGGEAIHDMPASKTLLRGPRGPDAEVVMDDGEALVARARHDAAAARANRRAVGNASRSAEANAAHHTQGKAIASLRPSSGPADGRLPLEIAEQREILRSRKRLLRG